jgi:uncharacterized protein (DUF1015 family)
MAEIGPFRAVHYNQALIDDLSGVICPPYDVISPQGGQELNNSSPYNFIRLEYGQHLLQDTEADNKYTRATATMQKWLKDGVLVNDDKPAIYIHDHEFTYQGKEYCRRGLVVRVRLEEWDKMVVRPHEGTLAGPKNDRINLLWALQANTSPIMALYEDHEKRLKTLLSGIEKMKPMLSFNQSNGEVHTLRAIIDPEMINEVADSLVWKPLYIADGHHRYESALIYRREQYACSSGISPDASLNYVMMTLIDFDDPGLVILPPHRLLRGLTPSSINRLGKTLISFFDVQTLALDLPDVWQRVDQWLAEGGKIRLVLFGLGENELLLLTLRDFTTASRLMPYFHSDVYKRMDVSVVDHIILEELLGLSSGEETRIAYNYDRLDAVRCVTSVEYQLAFIIKPVRAQVIKAIADVGDRMPRKSTYFYPKLPSGLLVHRLN